MKILSSSQTENLLSAIFYLLFCPIPLLNLLQNTFLPENRLRSGEIFFDAALLANPVKIPNDPLFQSHRRQITCIADQGSVRYQMPHLTGAKLPIHDRLKRYFQRVRNHCRDLFNRDRSTAADIYRLSVYRIRTRRLKIRRGDILYKTEITRLLSVFVNYRR